MVVQINIDEVMHLQIGSMYCLGHRFLQKPMYCQKKVGMFGTTSCIVTSNQTYCKELLLLIYKPCFQAKLNQIIQLA